MQNREFHKSTAKNLSFFQKIKRKLLHLFRLTNKPVVKVYHGYGNASQMSIFGHVLSLSSLPRKRYRQSFLSNALALVRSFMVRPVSQARVRLHWADKTYEAITASDGFFRFVWNPEMDVQPGVYKVAIEYYRESGQGNVVLAKGKGSVLVAYESQYAFISDIDDTFLVSHSVNVRRKLYVLLTKNAHSRQPFEGVVKHYKLLSYAHTDAHSPNPFFYVSSSEWNLYDFIKEFCRKNEMPEGVFLLSQMKKFGQLLKTGSNKHGTKFMRIARILEAYPTHKFVLLGDDSQMDPIIYESIVSHFPDRVFCVYLRHIHHDNISNVRGLIKKMEANGVLCCHFKHSKHAIRHSAKTGLIKENPAELL